MSHVCSCLELPIFRQPLGDTLQNSQFRKKLLLDGFVMFQFSIYIRHCQSAEAADAHVRRVKSILPEYGQVGILAITDKQFGSMEIYMERKPNKPPVDDFPLELF